MPRIEGIDVQGLLRDFDPHLDARFVRAQRHRVSIAVDHNGIVLSDGSCYNGIAIFLLGYRPQVLALYRVHFGGYFFCYAVDVGVGGAFEPSQAFLIDMIDVFERAVGDEVVLSILDERFDPALAFRVAFSAEVDAESNGLPVHLKGFRQENIAVVFADDHELVLVHHHFFGDAAEVGPAALEGFAKAGGGKGRRSPFQVSVARMGQDGAKAVNTDFPTALCGGPGETEIDLDLLAHRRVYDGLVLALMMARLWQAVLSSQFAQKPAQCPFAFPVLGIMLFQPVVNLGCAEIGVFR
nr:hypothetical protein [Heliomicrobium undosum]